MHAAPPVRVALGRSQGWVTFVAACGALAALQIVAWLAQGREWPGAIAATASLSSAATAGLVSAWVAWRAQQPGSLSFDGQRWQWLDRPGRLTLAIDLQAWMMLRFEPDTGMPGRRCWIAASRRGVGAAWPSLRAALYSSGADAAVDPPPPVAPPG
jgi:hypothetical protein